MSKYLKFNEFRKRKEFDLSKMNEDYAELYLKYQKKDSNLSYTNLIGEQIFLSFSITFVMLSLVVGIGLLVDSFIFSFSDYTSKYFSDYVFIAIPFISYFLIYFYNTKYRVNYIKKEVCKKSIHLGMCAYRDNLYFAKHKLNQKEFRDLIETECKSTSNLIDFYIESTKSQNSKFH